MRIGNRGYSRNVFCVCTRRLHTGVAVDGSAEGRRTFANTIKYRRLEPLVARVFRAGARSLLIGCLPTLQRDPCNYSEMTTPQGAARRYRSGAVSPPSSQRA